MCEVCNSPHCKRFVPIQLRKLSTANCFKSAKKLRNFDESAKEFSDIVLKVDSEKFYVLKTYLASHSSYFKSLLLGNYDESKQSEIELKRVDKFEFQYFLEVIHAEPAITNNNVDGILKLADMYDSKTAIRRCEEFLMDKSQSSLKMKFDLAIKYKMDQLKEKCLFEMTTTDDIRSVVPTHLSQFDYSVWAELLNKALDLK